MKKLTFNIKIAADRHKVWDTMFNVETYKEWVKPSWPGAYYKGTWQQGENMKFLSASEGGTMANLVEHKPYEFVLAKHVAVINNDGTEDRSSDIAKGWIGTTESYTFSDSGKGTELTVNINTNPAWESMFADGWPKALAKLKEICEN
jgi:hypothetical protein